MARRPTAPTQLLTSARIAQFLGAPVARVRYVLRAYRAGIPPAAVAGRVRLFHSSAVEQVARVLAAADALKSTRIGAFAPGGLSQQNRTNARSRG